MSKLQILWFACFSFIGIFLFYLTFFGSGITLVSLGIWKYILIALLAFFCEYMDSSIGMGYGTTLTPILMILGFHPAEIVPLILGSEMITGISSGFLHHKEGNVNFSKSEKPIRKTLLLSVCSIVGVAAAVLFAIQLPKFYVKLYIGAMILLVGLFLKFGKNLLGVFSWWKLILLGGVAAFNKGISGGGYGPLLTGGQILTGSDEKESISITSLTEGIVCIFGLLFYILFTGFSFNWSLGLPLLIGAILSVPLATKTVKYLPKKILQKTISYSTIYLGLLCIFKILFK